MSKLKMLDAFAGIGGISFALSSIANTVGYVEIDKKCQDVLHHNIKRKLLHKAPIFYDIRSITPQLVRSTGAEIVSAGFPCQDISTSGGHRGLRGGKSSIYKEVIRVCAECPSIRAAFFENSYMMLHAGNIKRFTRDLRNSGFRYIAYGTFSAFEVGALHRRLRWFCIATKDDQVIRKLKPCKEIQFPQWHYEHEPCERLVKSNHSLFTTFNTPEARRLGMLGNSVVPQQVRYAWNCIVHTLINMADNVQDNRRITNMRDSIVVHNTQCNTTSHCDKINTTMKQQHKPPLRVLHDHANNKTYYATYWMTPTRHGWPQCRNLTDRCSGMPGNQIYYDTKTPIPNDVKRRNDISMTYTINPCFIEWLMGYPQNYTKL